MRRLVLISGFVLGSGLLSGAVPAGDLAEAEYSLADRFSIALEGSWVDMNTSIRLDSKRLGLGTSLDFESDGGLESSQLVPSLAFEWQVGRRHRVGGWWQDVDRRSNRQIIEEIQFGDAIFPVDERVTFNMGYEEYAVHYTYFPVAEGRWAWGFGGGIRTLKVSAGLTAQELEVSDEGDFTAPLPFLWTELRYGLTPKLRLVSKVGLFYLEYGDYTGGQVVLDSYIEHMTFSKVSFGGGLRGGWAAVELQSDRYTGKADLGLWSARAFVRLRF